MMADTIKTRSDKMNIKLINAVIDCLGYENQNDPDCIEDMKNINSYGIDGGFGGFVYYHETSKFFDDNRNLIIDLAREQSEDFGVGMLEMIQGFNCFKNYHIPIDEIGEVIFGNNTDDLENAVTIKNALSWYAGEEVSRHIIDEMEDA
jgi:hypothetical protein|tara:strand:+ start:110 stop:553 length:444 start_codon:yes stop_codon:yes gene_type:complete